ncbi:MAG: vWA domain-containing protein, partial [Anaerolineae bacterium]
EQARQALDFVLDNLNDEDRFNVIAFSTATQAYARDLVWADERGEARDFVRRLEANGSTDINRALLEAAAMAGEERPTTIIFLTDGLPTVGEVDVDRIIDNVAGAAAENVRIFPFGVGYDVNTLLLDTIAQNHRGASGYVRPEEAIDEKVSAFYAKVSTPLLADLALDLGQVRTGDVYPYPLPDLFAGSQLVVVGRYRDGGETTVRLTGEVNGEEQVFEYEGVRLAAAGDGGAGGGGAFIARLWATRKIGYLLQQIRLHGEERELVDEVVELSVRYGIITPYTSFLVEEPEMALSEEGRAQIVETVEVEAPAAAAGQDAVNRSEGEKLLSQAEAPAPLPTMTAGPAGTGGGQAVASPVRYVGDKTFLLHDGVWTDTTFDADRMETVPVGFGSDDYFALLAARPTWGPYLALGEHVIVVLEGTAYEVREGEAPPLVLPAGAGEPEADEPAPPPAQEDEPDNLFDVIVQAIVDLFEAIVDAFRK